MIRSKLLLLLLSGALIFTACEDITTDPGEENGDPVEPTISINNPSDGVTLEGEITVAVDGESENGFDEARIFVGDEQVETISDPSLPYEQTIATYNYDNGDYDLSAELDATDQDTTVEASVSVTLENYLVEIETNGRISTIKEEGGTDELLFVAASDGTVLKKIDLLQQQDGTLQILPPSELPDGPAPESFNMTTVTNAPDEAGNNSFLIITDGGFESWTDITSFSFGSGQSGTQETTDIDVNLENYPDNHHRFHLFSPFTSYLFQNETSSGQFSGTYQFQQDTDNLILTTIPDIGTYSSDNPPLYYWDENLENGETLNLDVSTEFNPMETHIVNWPSDVQHGGYRYMMSIDPNSTDSGYFTEIRFDNAPSGGSMNMYVPNTDHQYFTVFFGADGSDENITYHHSEQGDLLDSFTSLNYSISYDNTSMDDMQISAGGSSDADVIFHVRNSQNHRWYAILPDTAEQFVYPNIADSLGQDLTSNYNRDGFTLSRVEILDIPSLDTYAEYAEEFYMLDQGLYPNNRIQKNKLLQTGQQKSLKRKFEYGKHTQKGFSIFKRR